MKYIDKGKLKLIIRLTENYVLHRYWKKRSFNFEKEEKKKEKEVRKLDKTENENNRSKKRKKKEWLRLLILKERFQWASNAKSKWLRSCLINSASIKNKNKI